MTKQVLLALLTATVLLTGGFAQEAPPTAAPPMPDPTALFNQALANFNHGDYQNALTTINTLLNSVPANLADADRVKLSPLLEPIYFTRGAAYFNSKQYGEAVNAIKDYLARYPNSTRIPEATFSLGEASYFNGDFDEAAKNFAALENNSTYREQALLLEGLADKQGGQSAKAIIPLEKLTANGIKSPTAARGAMQLVSLYADAKHPEAALKMLSLVQANIDQLENVVELNSVALSQGDAFLESGANAEALTCYRAVRNREQVIAIEHDRIAALQKRLETIKLAAQADPKVGLKLFLTAKQVQDSIAEDQQLVDTFAKLPTIYPQVLYRMGRALYQASNPWEAIVAYQDSYNRSRDPAAREPALFGIITADVDVSQAAAAGVACNQYLKEFPQGTNTFTVGYLLGATALQNNDPKGAESDLSRMLAEQPASTLREEMEFLLANAQFAQGKYDDADASYARYEREFPKGTHLEEATYRVGLGKLFAGSYDEATVDLKRYLTAYPAGAFVGDAKYRLAVCQYAQSKYPETIASVQAWLTEYPHDKQRGEVEALLADAYVATGKTDEALAAYQISFQTATTDEVLDYSLQEAGKILQKRGDWEADATMFADFVKMHPDNSAVVTALAQVGRAEVKEGKVDEAKQFLADTLKKYIDDPKRGSVEEILDQLALLCVRKKPIVAAPLVAASPGAGTPVAGAPATTPALVAAAAPQASPAPDPGAELDQLLGASLADRSPTAQARILYAKAQLARLRHQPAEVEQDFLAIAAKYKPAVLSPTILGQVGDMLLAQGKLDEAAPFYQALLDNFPKDDNVDFAYAGLGEIAYQKKQYESALGFFRDGTDKISSNQKTKDLTVGQAKTLLAMGKLAEAKKIFEQAASVREWRGETTAYCVYSLGEIEAKGGHWAEANAYYQRVFVAYQRYLPWVAKAYLGSAASFEKLGKKEEAVKTYQEMLRNPKLADFSETNTARQRLKLLGAG